MFVENERKEGRGRKLKDQEVHRISKKDVKASIKRIKNAKVIGLNDIPVEVWSVYKREEWTW